MSGTFFNRSAIINQYKNNYMEGQELILSDRPHYKDERHSWKKNFAFLPEKKIALSQPQNILTTE